MAIDQKLTQIFRCHSMADKQDFIDSNLYYVSMQALAEHTRAYWRDMLDAINDPMLVADWLRERGFTVMNPNNKHSSK